MNFHITPQRALVFVDTMGGTRLQHQPDQVKDVFVPKQDRQELAEAMRAMYARTGSKQYEPNDNMRRFYLLSKSPAAEMILPPPKK